MSCLAVAKASDDPLNRNDIHKPSGMPLGMHRTIHRSADMPKCSE